MAAASHSLGGGRSVPEVRIASATHYFKDQIQQVLGWKKGIKHQTSAAESRSEQGSHLVLGKGAGSEQGTRSVLGKGAGSEQGTHLVLGKAAGSEQGTHLVLGKGAGSEQGTRSVLGKGAGSEQGTHLVLGKGAGSEQGTHLVLGKGAGSEQGTHLVLGKGAGSEQGTHLVLGKGAVLEQGTHSVLGKGAGLEQGTHLDLGKGAGSEQGTRLVLGKGAGLEQGTHSVLGKGAGSGQGTHLVLGKGAGLEQSIQPSLGKVPTSDMNSQPVTIADSKVEQKVQVISLNSELEPINHQTVDLGSEQVTPGFDWSNRSKQGTQSVLGEGAVLQEGTQSVLGEGAGLDQGAHPILTGDAELDQVTQPFVSCNLRSERMIQFVVENPIAEKYVLLKCMNEGRGTRQGAQPVLSEGRESKQAVQPVLSERKGSKQEVQSIPGVGKGSEPGVQPVLDEGRVSEQEVQPVLSEGSGSEQGIQPVLSEGSGSEQGVQPVLSEGSGSEQGVQPVLNEGKEFEQGIKMNLGSNPRIPNVDVKLGSDEKPQATTDSQCTQSTVDQGAQSKQRTKPVVVRDVRSTQHLQSFLSWEKRSEHCIHLPLDMNRISKQYKQPLKCHGMVRLEPWVQPAPNENTVLEQQIFISLTRNLSYISGLYDSVRLADGFGPPEEQDSPDGLHLGPGKKDLLPQPIVRRRAKSCPGSPTERRVRKNSIKSNINRVRFADSLGLELTEVRSFNSTDEPNVPDYVFNSLINREPITQLIWVQSFKREFTNPKEDVNFDERVNRQKVCLEAVTDTELVLSGTILVLNLAYHKKVIVRYTCDDWNTFTDVPALFESSNGDETDRFTFTLNLSVHVLKPGSSVQFAIRYTVNGIDFWDNNDSNNYTMTYQPFQITVPVSDDSLVNSN